MTQTRGAALPPPGSELATRLELTFRLLGRRIYRTSPGQLRAICPGLDKASLPLLAALEDHDQVRPSDVAATVELDLSTVSRHLRQMEQCGFVERRPDGADGRACRISLTAQGRQSLSAVRASRAAMLDDVFGGWPDTERRRMQRLLDRLLADLAALPAATVPAATVPAATMPAATMPAATMPESNMQVSG
jgi:DNA-binding MarR family transcriptional regulator